jgi:hypothetical protein
MLQPPLIAVDVIAKEVSLCLPPRMPSKAIRSSPRYLECYSPVTVLYYTFTPSSEAERSLPDAERPRLCIPQHSRRADPNFATAATTPVPPQHG